MPIQSNLRGRSKSYVASYYTRGYEDLHLRSLRVVQSSSRLGDIKILMMFTSLPFAQFYSGITPEESGCGMNQKGV